MSRLTNSIHHRKCYRRQSKQENLYDIKLKKIEAIERLLQLRITYPSYMIEYAEADIERKQ